MLKFIIAVHSSSSLRLEYDDIGQDISVASDLIDLVSGAISGSFVSGYFALDAPDILELAYDLTERTSSRSPHCPVPASLLSPVV